MANRLVRDLLDQVQSAFVHASGGIGLQEWGDVDLWGAVNADRVTKMAFEDAIANGYAVKWPSGRGSAGAPATLKFTEPLHWDSPLPRLSGGGPMTVLEFDDTDYDWLTIGSGVNGYLGPAGWVRDFQLRGKSGAFPPAGTHAGIKLNNLQWVALERLWIAFQSYGVDQINNNYFTTFRDVHTLFGECRIGLVLRGLTTDFGAGNDQEFLNCVFHGADVGVWEEGANGNYHFKNGQILGGLSPTSNASDDYGSIVIGPAVDDITTPMGSAGLSLDGVVLEGIGNWGIRGYGAGSNPNGLHISMSNKTSFLAGPGAIGRWKITGGYNDTVEEIGVGTNNGGTVDRVFSGAVPCVYEGNPGARAHFYGVGSYGTPTFNGVVLDFCDRGPFTRSQLMKATEEMWGMTLKNGKLYWSADDGITYVSYDWGATWPNRLTEAVL